MHGQQSQRNVLEKKMEKKEGNGIFRDMRQTSLEKGTNQYLHQPKLNRSLLL